MSRAVVVLGSPTKRQLAASWCMEAPAGTIVEFKQNKRSGEQNSRMWAMLTEVARQVTWPDASGVKLSADDWKIMFMSALNQEMRLVPNLSKTGYVNLGTRSSQLTKAEFGDLMTLIEEFGARHGVIFGDEVPQSPATNKKKTERA